MTIGKVLIDYDKETKQFSLDIYYKFEIMQKTTLFFCFDLPRVKD